MLVLFLKGISFAERHGYKILLIRIYCLLQKLKNSIYTCIQQYFTNKKNIT